MRPETGEQWSDPVLDKLYELTAEVECEVSRIYTLRRGADREEFMVKNANLSTNFAQKFFRLCQEV